MSLKSICRDVVPSNPPMRWLEQGKGDSRQESMPEQKLVKLKINDREMQVPQGMLVIEATRRIGTEVPSFCYYPGLSLHAACAWWRWRKRRNCRRRAHWWRRRA